jgi:predicted TIM-barrel fold metal-dependent hydrolase
MGMPTNIGIIDLAMGTRTGIVVEPPYEHLWNARAGAESQQMRFPVEYLFKDMPYAGEKDPPQGAELLLPEMDRYGIEIAMIGVDDGNESAQGALRSHPDRFAASYEIDPNQGMPGVRDLVRMHEAWGIRAATAFPAGYLPQVPVDSKRMYPFYAKCVELGIPVVVNAGVPGPRVAMACQDVALFDEVCYDFPELRIVMRHGGEPWVDLAVKLMLKWPGLFYMTSSYAPRHYPRAIIDFANTRGAEKIMYAGYFPMALSLERIFRELPDVPLRDGVWPKFLRDNAARVFGIG